VIFVAAFFMLGFVYDREGSLGALLARVKSILTGKEGKPGQRRKFAYKQHDDAQPQDQGSQNSQAANDPQEAYKEELRRKRAEDLKRERGD
jgi:hypothetical protein